MLYGIVALVVALLSIPLCAGVIGLFVLPESYEATVKATFKKPPEAVFAAILDYKTHPMAGAQVHGVAVLPDEGGMPVWKEDLGATQLVVRTLESVPNQKLRRELKDTVVPMTAISEMTFAPDGDGVTVTGFGRTTVRRGTFHVPIFRIILSLRGQRASVVDLFDRVGKTLGDAPIYS
jgi:hypothetical protein